MYYFVFCLDGLFLMALAMAKKLEINVINMKVILYLYKWWYEYCFLGTNVYRFYTFVRSPREIQEHKMALQNVNECRRSSSTAQIHKDIIREHTRGEQKSASRSIQKRKIEMFNERKFSFSGVVQVVFLFFFFRKPNRFQFLNDIFMFGAAIG